MLLALLRPHAEELTRVLLRFDWVLLLIFGLVVTQASGVGEFRIAVDGPVSADISQSFLLPKGLDLGRQQLGVQLKVKDHTSGDDPVVWKPGVYRFDFEVCQGECGSKHPHSKDFGKITGKFTLKEDLTGNHGLLHGSFKAWHSEVLAEKEERKRQQTEQRLSYLQGVFRSWSTLTSVGKRAKELENEKEK
eukprot:g23648.t1